MKDYSAIKHVWSILCRRSVIDGDSNIISLFDIFEQVDVGIKVKSQNNSKQNINIPLNYEVVSLWVRDDFHEQRNFTFKIELKDPDRKVLKEFEQNVVIPKQKRRTRTRVKITGLPITISGIYMFEVFFKQQDKKEYEKVASLPLQLNIKKRELTKEPIKN